MATDRTIITDELYDYISVHAQPEPPLMQELRKTADQLEHATWRSSLAQMQFITMLIKLMGVRNCIEVGTFVGYSSLWLATALPPDGRLVTMDLNDQFPAVGRPFWQQAGVAERIDLRLGKAMETLEQLLIENGENSFDAAFIDANKKEYVDYYESCLKLVRPGGLLLIDNILWHGQVVDQSDNSKATTAIRKLNALIRDDQRVEAVSLPFNDGLTIARVG